MLKSHPFSFFLDIFSLIGENVVILHLENTGVPIVGYTENN